MGFGMFQQEDGKAGMQNQSQHQSYSSLFDEYNNGSVSNQNYQMPFPSFDKNPNSKVLLNFSQDPYMKAFS